jgi:hypothetical protein
MKRLFLAFFLIAGAVNTVAQEFPAQQWHLGEIRFTDDTFRMGKIKYDLEHDAVQLQVRGRTETYSAQQVASFRLIYEKARVSRYFFTLPYENKAGREVPRFFEVMAEGKVTLLAREYIATVSTGNNARFGRRRGLNDPYNRNFGSLTRNVLAHRMYVVGLDGVIKELNTRRKDVLAALNGHNDELKAFIKDEELKIDRVSDMARLVGYYNAISTEQTRAY